MKKFDHLIIVGRPASGKSELIDFMKGIGLKTREQRYHIGNFEEMDDFVWIWEKFEEDNLWEQAGFPRVYSNVYNDNFGIKKEQGRIFELMLARFNKEIKRYTQNPSFYDEKTLFIEFSRGGKDGYKNAFSKLSDEIYSNAAVLYLKVSFEESWRKNVARYEEKKKHSILAHMVPRETMDAFYKEDDWATFTNGEEYGFLTVRNNKIPFITMNNEPELKDPKLLDERYGSTLGKLWELYTRRNPK